MINLCEPLRLSGVYETGQKGDSPRNLTHSDSEREIENAGTNSKQPLTGVSSFVQMYDRVGERELAESTEHPQGNLSSAEPTLTTIEDLNAGKILDDLVVLNKLGMEFLSQGKFQDSHEKLKGAQ